MSTNHITIRPADEEDRFDRFRLISWWDQEKLTGAKILVIGAGALGNEIIKNLALLGIGNLFIADLDRIENSNLSRSILFREADNGAFKAEVAARCAKEIFPALNVRHFNGNIVYDLGLGVFRWADVVIAGLDNREARLAINRNCGKVNRPWIDGAIEQIEGVARVFAPGGPCYECTMSAADWKLLQHRRSCNLLTRSQMQEGRTPTTPTVSSIIAGVQCQEAVKLLHGMETIKGRGWIFSGLTTDAYQIEYQRKQDCMSHDTLEEIISIDAAAETTTAAEMLSIARAQLGSDAMIELGRDVLKELACPKCHDVEEMYASLGRVSADKANCPRCSSPRDVVTFHTISANDTFLDRTLAQIGVPPLDILVARNNERTIGFELSADAERVLGRLSGGEEGLEWT